ncbi:MAG: hypothetical protein GKS03_11340 [Alphaproteobacteria bacterium]|nr:hypothetical protein [Alphaproteobacteria bacterium]
MRLKLPNWSLARTIYRTQRWRSLIRSNSGFGGVELIINIVLIGIVFLLLLKAEEGIDYVGGVFTARRVETTQLLIFSYREDHSFLPGDDPLAPRRFRRDQARTRNASGNYADLTDNNVIDGYLLDGENILGEQFTAWRDMRFSGKIDGDPSLEGLAALPSNLFGGIYGLDSGNLGMEDGSLCLSNLPGLTAEVIDKELDDGVISTGNVVATARLPEIPDDAWGHYDEPDSEPYDPDKRYLLCTTQLPL